MGGRGGLLSKKMQHFFHFFLSILFPRATPVPSANITHIWLVTVLVKMSPINDQMAEPFRLKIVQLK